MKTRQELHSIAYESKKKIDDRNRRDSKSKENQQKREINKLVKTCHAAMAKAAGQGRFSCGVRLNCNDHEVRTGVIALMEEFTPSWAENDYYKTVIYLRWN